MKPSGSASVMASRVEDWDSLDLFPTPPWAVRTVVHHMMDRGALALELVHDPACGLGHMVEVMGEFAALSTGADVHDYGFGYPKIDFVSTAPMRFSDIHDWIITNPPFNRFEEFVIRAHHLARKGVVFIARLSILEGQSRWRLFQHYPPTLVGVFSSRVPMVKGRYDPNAVTATAYCAVKWEKNKGSHPFPTIMLPPDARGTHFKKSDLVLARRVAPGMETPAPLLEASRPAEEGA